MCVRGVVFINVHGYLCVACACVCGCVYMCISVCIHACECLLNCGYKSTIIPSVTTQVQNKTHTVLAIVLVTCFMAHITLDITIAMHMEGMPPQQKKFAQKFLLRCDHRQAGF